MFSSDIDIGNIPRVIVVVRDVTIHNNSSCDRLQMAAIYIIVTKVREFCEPRVNFFG